MARHILNSLLTRFLLSKDCPFCRTKFKPLHLGETWASRPLPAYNKQEFDSYNVKWRRSCRWCLTSVPYEDSAEHVLTCSRFSTTCEDCRGTIELRNNYRSLTLVKEAFLAHFVKDCMAKIRCPWCWEKHRKDWKVERRHLSDHLARHENLKSTMTDMKTWMQTFEKGEMDVDSASLSLEMERYSVVRHVSLCRLGRGKPSVAERIQAKAVGLTSALCKRTWRGTRKIVTSLSKRGMSGVRKVASVVGLGDLVPPDECSQSEHTIRARLGSV
jgi:hypothetical protein